MKKYDFTGQEIKVNNHNGKEEILREIVALVALCNGVEAGTKGGYIASTDCLDQENFADFSWVHAGAYAFAGSRVERNSEIFAGVRLYEETIVRNSKVGDFSNNPKREVGPKIAYSSIDIGPQGMILGDVSINDSLITGDAAIVVPNGYSLEITGSEISDRANIWGAGTIFHCCFEDDAKIRGIVGMHDMGLKNKAEFFGEEIDRGKSA